MELVDKRVKQMLRKDYWECCVNWVLGFVMQKVLAPLLFVWVTYYYLNLNLLMTRGISYYGSICMWILIVLWLCIIGNDLIVHSNKIYENDYGVKVISIGTTRLDTEADKLKLIGKDRELFKKRKYKVHKLFACDTTSLFNIIRDYLLYGSLGFLAGVVVFMFLYLLTAMPVMITLSCELVKLGLAAFFAGFCWSM